MGKRLNLESHDGNFWSFDFDKVIVHIPSLDGKSDEDTVNAEVTGENIPEPVMILGTVKGLKGLKDHIEKLSK